MVKHYRSIPADLWLEPWDGTNLEDIRAALRGAECRVDEDGMLWVTMPSGQEDYVRVGWYAGVDTDGTPHTVSGDLVGPEAQYREVDA